MKNQFLISLDSCLKIGHGQVLSRAMCYKNVSRTVQVSCVVALEVGNVSSVVDGDFLET